MSVGHFSIAVAIIVLAIAVIVSDRYDVRIVDAEHGTLMRVDHLTGTATACGWQSNGSAKCI